jgi:hypothetical protein
VTILPILSALDVFPPGAYDDLGANGINWSREFKAGNWVPFCGNVVVEKLQCEDADYIRVLSNQMPGINHDATPSASPGASASQVLM